MTLPYTIVNRNFVLQILKKLPAKKPLTSLQAMSRSMSTVPTFCKYHLDVSVSERDDKCDNIKRMPKDARLNSERPH